MTAKGGGSIRPGLTAGRLSRGVGTVGFGNFVSALLPAERRGGGRVFRRSCFASAKLRFRAAGFDERVDLSRGELDRVGRWLLCCLTRISEGRETWAAWSLRLGFVCHGWKDLWFFGFWRGRPGRDFNDGHVSTPSLGFLRRIAWGVVRRSLKAASFALRPMRSVKELVREVSAIGVVRRAFAFDVTSRD